MAEEPRKPDVYVFSKETVLRSIGKLIDCKIHEHFAGYLAILRGLNVAAPGEPVRSKVIWDLHNRYLSVECAPDSKIYVRPFASRGNKGLVTFNPNVAGSYSAASIRARSKLSNVIDVDGDGQNATYGLKDRHAALARESLLNNKVPVGALAAFLYRDFGFRLESPDVARVIRLFREEFGLAEEVQEQQEVFETLFVDDATSFRPEDLELLPENTANG